MQIHSKAVDVEIFVRHVNSVFRGAALSSLHAAFVQIMYRTCLGGVGFVTSKDHISSRPFVSVDVR